MKKLILFVTLLLTYIVPPSFQNCCHCHPSCFTSPPSPPCHLMSSFQLPPAPPKWMTQFMNSPLDLVLDMRFHISRVLYSPHSQAFTLLSPLFYLVRRFVTGGVIYLDYVFNSFYLHYSSLGSMTSVTV